MFNRDHYLNQLINGEDNHLVKLITGIKGCGKSYLLNVIFYNYLINVKKINPNNIIQFAFDSIEDIAKLDKYLPEQKTSFDSNGQKLINNRRLLLYIQEKTKNPGYYYFLFDEIQNLDEFVRVLNGFLRHENYDIYVTGSNSKFLSSQVDTEFAGRADRIHLLPLSFLEYLSGVDTYKRDALDEYIKYGGLPLVQLQKDEHNKAKQALSILNEIYIKDVKDRHPNIDTNNLNDTLHVIASMISTPINPTKIERTFQSVYNKKFTNDTISNYITWFEEEYLLNKAFRYDVKGRKYIGTPYKVSFEDIGIRNATLNFRDIDETDIIENIIYNELRYRGFNVDVGVVKINTKVNKDGKIQYVVKATEVDFVANNGEKKYYVQVALRIDTEEKKNQEYESIRNIPDSFKKIIVVKEEGKHYYTNEGF
ncbi:MAG: ATP-binding protein [Candidatus Caccosoma sp.]|nr:ATP-binding protein [Candidatus Caccosoma sp.]